MTPERNRATARLGLDISHFNDRLDRWSPGEILAWAWETFKPKIAASSSFQTQSVPLLHIIARVCPEMPVIFIDTGFHFLETLAFRDELQARYSLNIVVARPAVRKNQLLEKYGEGLYRRDPDLCCYINKVEPMQRMLSRLNAWVSGVRRDQTAHRSGLRMLKLQPGGLLKVHPMLNWTKQEVWDYIERYRLPYHPLYPKGYLSVGCAPCTRPVSAGEDERAGRWAGTEKAECGLHTDWGNSEFLDSVNVEEQNDRPTE
ncbi:MAG: phosphoadenylyl-sulfate reductase [Chloroflexota bacterium]|nr:phosphoadenylyl-sulfate reductase [Chloroflexota bacterium]